MTCLADRRGPRGGRETWTASATALAATSIRRGLPDRAVKTVSGTETKVQVVMLISHSESEPAAEARGVRSKPLARFLQLVPGRAPVPADRSVGGTLPVRALRYCEPVAQASAFGWYVFLPMRFQLLFDGAEIFWRCAASPEFAPLRSVHYPEFAPAFDASVPVDVRGFAPAFLTASAQVGSVQIWPGLMVRTRPGWSLLVRPVANLARPSGYELYEGIIETDSWLGGLFTNARLTRTGVPIDFDDDIPFMQLQPLQQGTYEENRVGSFSVDTGTEALTEDDWDAYRRTVVMPCSDPERRHGRYAREYRALAAKRDRDTAN